MMWMPLSTSSRLCTGSDGTASAGGKRSSGMVSDPIARGLKSASQRAPSTPGPGVPLLEALEGDRVAVELGPSGPDQNRVALAQRARR